MSNIADTIPPRVYLSGGTELGQSLLQAADAEAARAVLDVSATQEPSANVPAPTGGATEDAEARSAINGILAILVAKGLMESESP